jgi:mannose-1-phosphate guanylyltransferase
MGHSVFLLAAGFGSRLRPLTNHRPKPLLPLMGRPMLDYGLQHLKNQGFDSFIINAHHLWKNVAEWAAIHDVEVQVELPEILGTGGGLKAAEEKMAETFLIWNGDILSDINARELIDACPLDGTAMALRYSDNLNGTTKLLRNDEGFVQRIGNLTFIDGAPQLSTQTDGIHFTGIHAMSRASLSGIASGFQCVVRSAYTQLVPKRKVKSILHKGMWFDTGTPPEYLEANLLALRGDISLSLDPWTEADQRYNDSWVHHTATVSGQIHESIIGEGAVVPKGATLKSCVVWDGATVPEGDYHRCIVHDGGVLQVD